MVPRRYPRDFSTTRWPRTYQRCSSRMPERSPSSTASELSQASLPRGYGTLRHGIRPDPDPNAATAKPFVADVTAPDYEEFWTDEI